MSKRQQTIKYIFYCLIILICDLLQNVSGLFPEIYGARCFLLLPVSIILAMGEDERNGALLGLFAGLLWDLTSGVHMGFNCIYIMLMCFFISTCNLHCKKHFYHKYCFNNSNNGALRIYLLAVFHYHKGSKRRRNDACNFLFTVCNLHTCAYPDNLLNFKAD